MNTDTSPNVIGFCCFIEDDKRIYGCRGIGDEYNFFYHNFITGLSYKSLYVDFPWDYFMFRDINDEQKFLKEYSKYINYMI